ncbi:MAG TPA: DUF348 domain-containing protein [Firmicutes bacterium]|nr:DUF348 domain-containing protein [Bacillota bacterium]
MSKDKKPGFFPARQKPDPYVQAPCFLLVSTLLLFAAFSLVYKQITLTVDGSDRKMITFRSSVAAVLEDAGVAAGPDDHVRPLPDKPVADGMQIEIRRAFPVTVHADGRTVTVPVVEANVAAVLEKAGIRLNELDRVEPACDYMLAPGDEVRVVRVERQLVAQLTEIPFREIRRGTDKLDRGTSRVVARGANGLQQDMVEIILEDGVEVSATVLSAEILRPREDRIIEYGENTILSRGGRVLDFQYVYTVTATAYCDGTEASGCPRDSAGRSVCTGKHGGGTTATGRKAVAGDGSEANPYIVSVDPGIIPLGSRLYLDGYGYGVAADTGGLIKGNRIDLLLDSHEAALRFGRRKLRVYVLAR